MSEKRKDSRGRILKDGESQRKTAHICIDTPIYIREENMYMLRH